MLLLIDANTILLSVSPSAKKTFTLRELSDDTGVLVPVAKRLIIDEYKLTYKKQADGMKILAAKVLQGEKEFDIIIKGKSYTVLVADIPEVKFYVIRLLIK